LFVPTQIGKDFINPLNDGLKSLFGENPEYIFCFNLINDTNITSCSFPNDINSDDKYNAIWFAGCNLSNWIFSKPETSIEKIKQVLKSDGIIVFTENKTYVNRYNGVNNLTLPIESLSLRAKDVYPPPPDELLDRIHLLFNDNFKQIIMDNHLLYTIKIQGGRKYRRLRKSKKYRQLRKSKKYRQLKKSKKYKK